MGVSALDREKMLLSQYNKSESHTKVPRIASVSTASSCQRNFYLHRTSTVDTARFDDGASGRICATVTATISR